MTNIDRDEEYEDRLRASEERLRLGEIAGGIATFEYDYGCGAWNWSAQAAAIFGRNEQELDHWEKAVFPDDVAKFRAAVKGATPGGNVYVEFRVRYGDESVHWIAAGGQIASGSSERLLRGAIYEISHERHSKSVFWP